MGWTAILWFLLQTLGPYLLELLLKWLMGKVGQKALFDQTDATKELGFHVPPGQYRRAKKLVEKYPQKWEAILAKISVEKDRLAAL
jgi:hypothetical protein